MKIFVTGATGTIGSQVAAALLDANADVRVGLRDPAKGVGLRERGAEVVRFDFEDASTYAAGFGGVDRVFMLSPFIEAFVPVVEQAAKAAVAAGVKFIVRMSAFGANPSADEGLSRQHGLAEDAVKNAGAGWAVLQPTFFQDNVLNYQGEAVAQGAFYGASGEGRTAYVSSRDIGEVAAKILLEPDAHDRKTYVLTGPEALSDAELAAALSKVAGREIRYVNAPAEQLLQGQLAAGVPRWMAEHLVALEGVKAAGWAAESTSAVPEILGRPAESVAAYLDRNAARLR